MRSKFAHLVVTVQGLSDADYLLLEALWSSLRQDSGAYVS